MDQIAEDEILDPDFKAFLEHQLCKFRCSNCSQKRE